ncbi:MAG: superinfection immunity protein [Actinomycetota bacterium]|nr:superinfection immunity protein [Actinomycetota bacterium]
MATQSTGNAAVVVIAWIVAVLSFLYMLPWAIAASRNMRDQWGLFAVNLLVGWTVIGWVIALIWSIAGSNQGIVLVQQTNVAVHNHIPKNGS